MRRATGLRRFRPVRNAISIHALHEESDDVIGGVGMAEIDFNPRSP